MYTLGVIGFGHMGGAMVESAIKNGFITGAGVIFFEKNPERANEAKSFGLTAAADERGVYENCRYLLVAVLPQDGADLLKKLSECRLENKPVIISIVSGIGSGYIRGFLGNDAKVINAVPNIALAAGCGATALSRTENVSDGDINMLLTMLNKAGYAALIDENYLKEVIPANGCGPGYAFYMISALADAVSAKGVEKNLAVKMSAAAFMGAAKMLMDANGSPDEFLAKVCSPGGLTAKGIDYFNERGLRDIIIMGAEESAKRGYELALE